MEIRILCGGHCHVIHLAMLRRLSPGARSIMAEITPVNIHRGLYLVENTTGIEFIFIIGIDITITV